MTTGSAHPFTPRLFDDPHFWAWKSSWFSQLSLTHFLDELEIDAIFCKVRPNLRSLRFWESTGCRWMTQLWLCCRVSIPCAASKQSQHFCKFTLWAERNSFRFVPVSVRFASSGASCWCLDRFNPVLIKPAWKSLPKRVEVVGTNS